MKICFETKEYATPKKKDYALRRAGKRVGINVATALSRTMRDSCKE